MAADVIRILCYRLYKITQLLHKPSYRLCIETRIVTVVNVFVNESTPESSACSCGSAAMMPASLYKLWSRLTKKDCRLAPVAWLCRFLLIVMMMMIILCVLLI